MQFWFIQIQAHQCSLRGLRSSFIMRAIATRNLLDLSVEVSMTVKLMPIHNLECLALKGDVSVSSETMYIGSQFQEQNHDFQP